MARGTLEELALRFDTVAARGELVVVIKGAPVVTVELSDDELRLALNEALTVEVSTRDAVAAVVAATGAPKRRVYGLAVELQRNGSTDRPSTDGPA